MEEGEVMGWVKNGEGKKRTVVTPAWQRTLDKCVEDGPLYDGTPCWVFIGSRTHGGYGVINTCVKNRRSVTHRVTYEYFRAEIPEGLQLDHLCRNRACCNPWHLDPVTQKENILRGEAWTAKNAKKTHCPYGHEYTPENTRTNEKGWRWCRECARREGRKRGNQRRQKATANGNG